MYCFHNNFFHKSIFSLEALHYNYFPMWRPSISQNCYELERIENYGCSIIPADHIYIVYRGLNSRTGRIKWKIPHFTDLHNKFAKPWCILACCDNLNWNTFFEYSKESKLIPYSMERIKKDREYWLPIELKEPKSFYKEIEFFSDREYKEVKEFKPKFRFILGQNERIY